jgi:glycosyltransferase involved in cell wall biosynthesis
MRIMLVPNSYPPQLGGLEVAAANVGRQLASRGHKITVVTSSPTLRISQGRGDFGLSIHRLPFALPRLVCRAGARRLGRSVVRSLVSPAVAPLCLFQLVRIIKRVRPEIVNVHYIAENAFFALAARRFVAFRLVANLHGDDIERYPHRSPPAQWLTRWTLSEADYVLANSVHILAQAERIVPDVHTKSAVIGNGVDLEAFESAEPFPHPRPYILSVGNFGRKKGFDVLIQAFCQVRLDHPGVDLVMAGDGYGRRDCQHLASDLGIADSVVFLGRVPNSQVPALLKGCQLFVLPSRQEPFGIVLLEAMAAKTPIVATRVGGVPEIITHGQEGLLVDAESPHSLAEGISPLLVNRALATALGAKGYDKVRRQFTWAAVCDRFEDAYRRVMTGGQL